ncbi:MAG: hypothetical protein A2754_01885 [Candidatus Magasanikbacteria bacterium RIFCSPHIGHO2_01_FULL_47_8]|uniref:Uncharacterized protein n=1 Tax=Candidatus Magasanikbacteria bacterium RIFCSPHIGHO2_01_FULL_47_8 TaxID=1798673 RepID=A0A1F6MAF6_9BACT|nr:MAG: hypothetical protein A2754_01885 [Candidatus Magasanikbacteria bacterium RIFCSPHIGHO2_01_FULL_47_8]
MFYSPKLYLRDWWVAVPLVVSAALQVVMWWYITSKISPTNEQIFLHYNIMFGIDLVGEWWKIFFAPIAGVAVLLINYFLSFSLYGSNKFLARLLSVFTICFQALLLVGVVIIVRLNI